MVPQYQRWYYLINFDLYQGKDPSTKETDEILYGKATAPLLMMMRKMSEDKVKLPYIIHIDNIFTSIYLLKGIRDGNQVQHF